jgi:mannan endo-1,4-beta-mannosidase
MFKNRLIAIAFFYCFCFLFRSTINTIKAEIPQEKSSEQKFGLNKKLKKELLEYFNSVIKNRLVIVGQHSGDGFNTPEFFDKYFLQLQKETDRVPLLLGIEYGWHANNDLNLINSYAINHSKKGGLVTITWHADDPFADGYTPRRNPIKNKVDVKKSIEKCTRF